MSFQFDMDRKEFLTQVGFGGAALLIPLCTGGLSSCKKSKTPVDFTLDISTGALASNGGSLVHNGVIVARTKTGDFIAVAASCTHQGTTVTYASSSNDFVCPNHGAQFDSAGKVLQGPAASNLTKFNTSLSGTSLRVFS